jgi:CHAT domain-containing protein/Tfp pilus assembly protein PilF
VLHRIANAIRSSIVGSRVAVWAVPLALLGFLLPVSPAEHTRQLVLGQSLELDLGPGQSHSYRIGLNEGQYAHVIVDQRGVDVVVDLFAPDGTKLSEIDGPDGAEGPEFASVIADLPGDYRIDVRPSDPDAPSGRYGIRIADLRLATPQDRDRVAAERHFAKGQQLFDGNTEARRNAIEEYKAAASLWHPLNDRFNEAMAYHALGFVYDSLSELSTAVEYYTQAVSIRRQLGDSGRMAKTLSSLGATYNSLGENDKAVDCLKAALPLRRAANDRVGEAYTLNNLASIYNEVGEAQQALDTYSSAMSLWQLLNDKRGEAYAQNGLGLVYFFLGEPQQGLDHFDQALNLSKSIKNLEQEGTWLTNIGRVYASLGDNQKALQYLSDALPLRQEVGDRVGVAYTLNNIGAAYKDLKEPRKALEFYTQALQLRRDIGDRRGEAESLHEIASAYEVLGEKDKAIDNYRQALTLRRAVGDQRAQASTLAGIARVERELGDLDDALHSAEEALSLVESLRTKVVRQDLRASYFASIRSIYELDIDLLLRLHRLHPLDGYLGRSFQIAERSRARGLLEVLSEAKDDIRQGVDPHLLSQKQELERLLTSKTDYQMRLLSRNHTEEQALNISREIDGILNELKTIEATIQSNSSRYSALTQPQILTVKEIQQKELDHDTALIEYFLGDEHSYVWAVDSGGMSVFSLPKRSQIEDLARRFYEATTSHKGAPTESVVETKSGNASHVDAGSALSDIILSPAERFLTARRLIVVSEGVLQYIPFAALPIPVHDPIHQGRPVPLISQHEIVYLPSASTLPILRTESGARRQSVKTVAILADPVFGGDDSRLSRDNERATTTAEDAILTRSVRDLNSNQLRLPRLPFTRREADAIAGVVGRGGTIEALDFKASLTTAIGPEVSKAGIVHFATHGLLNTVHPELSGLVLSLFDGEGKPENGFLKLQDVYNLRFSARLVVLSACQTALGEDIRGEGLVGLTRGFMYAGVPAVMASLWNVDDASTAELMKRFYRALINQHLPPAAALRYAQRYVSNEKRWSRPYYWAGFVLQGDWK